MTRSLNQTSAGMTMARYTYIKRTTAIGFTLGQGWLSSLSYVGWARVFGADRGYNSYKVFATLLRFVGLIESLAGSDDIPKSIPRCPPDKQSISKCGVLSNVVCCRGYTQCNREGTRANDQGKARNGYTSKTHAVQKTQGRENKYNWRLQTRQINMIDNIYLCIQQITTL